MKYSLKSIPQPYLVPKKNSNEKKIIISLGGGAITNKKIRKLIEKYSYNIYLQVKIDILITRLKNSKNRPLIINKNLNATLKELINKRKKFYQKADLIIYNENNLHETVKKIINKINLWIIR